MKYRSTKFFALCIAVTSLGLALAASPAKAASVVSQTTTDGSASTQIAYESTSYSDGSISNASATLEDDASVEAEVELASTAAEDVDEAHAPGWAFEDGAYRYYEADGTMRASAWLYANDAWYYLGEDGHALVNERLEENGVYYYFGADGTFSTSSTSSATGSLAAVTNACYSTPSTGSGGCAAWVSNVFANAGIGSWHGNACDFYWSWCTSSDLNDLKPGMIIAVSSCAGTSASRAYGHVGIYLGNGVVMQNLLGSVGTMLLDTWLDYFDGYSTPAWGWLGGVVLV